MSHAITGDKLPTTQPLQPLESLPVPTTRALPPIESLLTATTPNESGSITNTYVQQNLSSVVAVSMGVSGLPKEVTGNAFYQNCRVYNVQTMNQNVVKRKRKYVIEDSSDESQ